MIAIQLFSAISDAGDLDRACEPDRRTIPMPPRPGGVEIAAMVSSSFNRGTDFSRVILR